MSSSRLDAVYRSILITKFFTKGWGKPDNLRRLFEFRKVVSNRDECFRLVERDYPVTITKDQHFSDCRLLEGYFTSPLARYLPGIVPEVAQKAHFQAVLPIHWPEPHCKPMCLHLAGTGDHFFWRRRNLMVKPLLKEAGIGGIILENPFYGLRKPTDQVRSSLHNVSDIFVMGGCLILESLVLFHWCERNGLGPLGVTGLSMGGHMASLAATNWPKPLVLVPCLSWSTASAVFLQGVMSHSINWDLLEDQYLSDGIYREKLSKMVTIVDEAFLAGKKFARTFSTNIDEKSNQTDKVESQPTQETAQTDQDKNLDITYNETRDQEVVEENSEEKAQVPKVDPILQTLNADLKKLLAEGKVKQALYDKLTSKDTFELNSKDIEEINDLTGNIKEALLKCKGAELKNVTTPLENAKRESQESNILLTNLSNANSIPPMKEGKDILNNRNNSSPTEGLLSDVSNLNLTTPIEAAKDTPKDTTKENKENQPEPKFQTKIEKKSWQVSDFTSDLWTNLPFRRPERKIDISKIHWRDREALQFMRGIMDECTHLSNFSVPFDTSLIIAVCAEHDAYVPREDVGTLEEIWPGAEVRYVDAGHVSAYILHQSVFRLCIKEAFERSKKRWKDGKHVD